MRISITSKMTTRRAAALLCIVLLSAAGSGVAETTGPRDLIERTIEQVLVILRDTSRDDAERRAALEQIANQRFDFRTMARLVMGRNWKRLDDAQRDELVAEFKTYLAHDYGSRIKRYDQEDVAVIGEEPKPRGDVVVATKIVGGENDGALVDYRLRRRNGEWRIIDVVVEGISLVANFRDQFGEVVARGGPEHLLRKLREKNAEQRNGAQENAEQKAAQKKAG